MGRLFEGEEYEAIDNIIYQTVEEVVNAITKAIVRMDDIDYAGMDTMLALKNLRRRLVTAIEFNLDDPSSGFVRRRRRGRRK